MQTKKIVIWKRFTSFLFTYTMFPRLQPLWPVHNFYASILFLGCMDSRPFLFLSVQQQPFCTLRSHFYLGTNLAIMEVTVYYLSLTLFWIFGTVQSVQLLFFDQGLQPFTHLPFFHELCVGLLQAVLWTAVEEAIAHLSWSHARTKFCYYFFVNYYIALQRRPSWLIFMKVGFQSFKL